MTKVLIIDDDRTLLSTMTAAFAQRDFEASFAANGREGLENYEAEQPHLVVTDIVMPEIEGIGVILELKRKPRPPKIIAICDGGYHRDFAYLTWARGLGADATLRKPFGMPALLAIADELLRPPAPARLWTGRRSAAVGRPSGEQRQLLPPITFDQPTAHLDI
jgi:two-component system response regulator VicR